MSASVYGVDAFEYAPPTVDGTLPTSGWKKVSPIADEAVTLDVPAVATTQIRAQDIPGVFEVLPGDTDPPTMKVTQLQVNGETAFDLLGGTWDPAAKRYDAPVGDTIKTYAARITSKPLNNQIAKFWIRKGAVLSGISVQAVRNDLYKLSFTVQGKTPIDQQGVPQSPWGFQIFDVVQTT